MRLINFAKLLPEIFGALGPPTQWQTCCSAPYPVPARRLPPPWVPSSGPSREEEGYDRDFSAAANIATALNRPSDSSQQCNDYLSLVSGGTSVAPCSWRATFRGISGAWPACW